MGRWALRILAAPALVLFLLSGFFLVRSFYVTDAWLNNAKFEDEGPFTFWTQDEVKIGRGGIGFHRIVQSGPSSRFRSDILNSIRRPQSWAWYSKKSPEYPNFKMRAGQINHYGFRYDHFETGSAGKRPRAYAWEVVVPLWSILALTAMPVIVLMWRWRRHRPRAGHCPSCGYDLRATPDRCPECGTIVATASVAPGQGG